MERRKSGGGKRERERRDRDWDKKMNEKEIPSYTNQCIKMEMLISRLKRAN